MSSSEENSPVTNIQTVKQNLLERMQLGNGNPVELALAYKHLTEAGLTEHMLKKELAIEAVLIEGENENVSQVYSEGIRD